MIAGFAKKREAGNNFLASLLREQESGDHEESARWVDNFLVDDPFIRLRRRPGLYG